MVATNQSVTCAPRTLDRDAEQDPNLPKPIPEGLYDDTKVLHGLQKCEAAVKSEGNTEIPQHQAVAWLLLISLSQLNSEKEHQQVDRKVPKHL
ncbi:hypothetical protein STEG23_010670 [Scotinomys teguina]